MDLKNFKWLNESKIDIKDNRISIYAPAKTDYFNNPVSVNGKFEESKGNAPFFYTEIIGDFVAKVKVQPNFETTFDACAIMLYESSEKWIKAAFERTHFGTNSIISVVTNGVSDDAYGCNINSDCIYLSLSRVNNEFAIHYSLDGVNYDMTRIFHLDVDKTVKVGIEAQCPTGNGGNRLFYDFSIENKTIENLRLGK